MRTLIFLVCLLPSLCFGQMVSGNARAGGNAGFGSAVASGGGSPACETLAVEQKTPGDSGARPFGNEGRTNTATWFTASSAGTVCSVRVTNMFKTGTPTGYAYACIYSTNGATGTGTLPLEKIGTSSSGLDVSGLPTVVGSVATFTDLSASVSANTSYFLVITRHGSDNANYLNIEWGNDYANGHQCQQVAGEAWTHYNTGVWDMAIITQ